MGRLIVIFAIVLSACGSVAASGSADNSYDRIEELRATRSVFGGDRSYDRIEELRIQRASPVSSDPYDTIEANRLTR